MLALIFTRKLRPMIIGSDSGWLRLAGMMARPRATSSRTNSGVDALAQRDEPHLLGDLALARVVHLAEVACRRAPRAGRSRAGAASAGRRADRRRAARRCRRRRAGGSPPPTLMRRTGTRMSPSVRKTRSEPGSSGRGASALDGSTAVDQRCGVRSPPLSVTVLHRASLFLRRHYPDQVQGSRRPGSKHSSSGPPPLSLRGTTPAGSPSCVQARNVSVAPPEMQS